MNRSVGRYSDEYLVEVNTFLEKQLHAQMLDFIELLQAQEII